MKNVLVISLISLIAIGCGACSAPYGGIPAETIPNDDFYSLVTDDMMHIRNPFQRQTSGLPLAVYQNSCGLRFRVLHCRPHTSNRTAVKLRCGANDSRHWEPA